MAIGIGSAVRCDQKHDGVKIQKGTVVDEGPKNSAGTKTWWVQFVNDHNTVYSEPILANLLTEGWT